jgi:FtsH-binding integral membrane protein
VNRISTHQHDGRRLAAVGAGSAVVLVVLAVAVSQLLPRETADSLYWLTSAFIKVALVALAVAVVSLVFQKASLTMLVAFLGVAVVIGLISYPTYNNERNEPTIFSVAALAPVALYFSVAVLIVLLLRLARNRTARNTRD